MIDASLAKLAEQTQKFLESSNFAFSHSPLPANTYHMTIYSIYQCGNRMIPPVARWTKETGVPVSKEYFLPDEVLQEQNDKAMCVIEKYLSEPLYIRYASLNVSTNIKLVLEAEEESLERLRRARAEFVKIYEDLDLSMEPIADKLHISFGYVYAPIYHVHMDELNEFNKLLRSFNGAKFRLPSVYLFDSMTNYIPYRKRNATIEC